MDKKKTYYFVESFKSIRWQQSKDGTGVWVVSDSENFKTPDIYEDSEIQDYYDTGLVVDETSIKELMEAAIEGSYDILHNFDKNLIGEKIYASTVVGEETFGILMDIDMDDCLLIFEDAIHFDVDNDKVVESLMIVNAEYLNCLRVLTEGELEFWVDEILQDELNAPDAVPGGKPNVFVEIVQFAKTIKNKYDDDDDLTLTGGKKDKEEGVPERRGVKLPKTYRPDLVNAEMSPVELAAKLKIALAKEERPDCISILLHGVPGTSKTMTAKYIAHELGVPLDTYKISDIFDKWIGSSEKNLAKAFKRAEKDNAILHFDEVDAMSGSRDDSDNGHQQKFVSSFLQCLDDFKGTIIMTTNSTQRMDSAIKRRVLLEVEMKNLEAEQADAFAKLFFPKQRIKGLKKGVYAPADFAKVKDSFIFIEDKDINKKFVLEKLRKAAEVRNESKQRRNPNGFELVSK